jgi:hypothetical protein
LTKLQDDRATKDELETPASTATAPPLLKEDSPVAPLVIVTRLLTNLESITLMLVKATLLAYIAPPPPFASPGRTDAALERTEHCVKRDFKINTVRLNPLTAGGVLNGIKNPCLNSETCGK